MSALRDGMLSAEDLQPLLEAIVREEKGALQQTDVTAYRYALSARGLLYGAQHARSRADQRKMLAAVNTLLEATRLLLWGDENVKAAEVN